MDIKRFNLASHWEELGVSCQKICLREIPFKDLMEITKGWKSTRNFRHLEERATRTKGESSHYPRYRRTADSERASSDSFRLTRRRPNKLSSGLKPFRHQHLSG
ncbi:hypothetical protein O181_024373 [Austropuccinia psidii MF-1]|uniref:Uncharacterized protein n=1 Tax=Austropuccinia psidii MF-1 TaxID=1389203 RepID=A0A9Q3GY60_9BASI|nr:hypothetical protein [Austropuccinia psidii MF-1]